MERPGMMDQLFTLYQQHSLGDLPNENIDEDKDIKDIIGLQASLNDAQNYDPVTIIRSFFI